VHGAKIGFLGLPLNKHPPETTWRSTLSASPQLLPPAASYILPHSPSRSLAKGNYPSTLNMHLLLTIINKFALLLQHKNMPQTTTTSSNPFTLPRFSPQMLFLR